MQLNQRRSLLMLCREGITDGASRRRSSAMHRISQAELRAGIAGVGLIAEAKGAAEEDSEEEFASTAGDSFPDMIMTPLKQMTRGDEVIDLNICNLLLNSLTAALQLEGEDALSEESASMTRCIAVSSLWGSRRQKDVVPNRIDTSGALVNGASDNVRAASRHERRVHAQHDGHDGRAASAHPRTNGSTGATTCSTACMQEQMAAQAQQLAALPALQEQMVAAATAGFTREPHILTRRILC